MKKEERQKHDYFCIIFSAALFILLIAKFWWFVGLGFAFFYGWAIASFLKKPKAVQWIITILKAAGIGVVLWFDIIRDFYRDFREWVWKHEPKPRAQWYIGAILSLLVASVFWLNQPSSVQANKLASGPASAAVPPASALVPYPDLVPAPLGMERYKSNAEQLAWRSNYYIDTRTFWIMREDGAIQGAERIVQADYQKFLDGAAKMYGVEKADIEAIHFLESFGKEDAKSPTGPIGPGQFVVYTASSIGAVKDGKCLLLFENQECVNDPDMKKVVQGKIAQDNRTSIELSVYATAKLLRKGLDKFGLKEFAFVSYHSGDGKVAEWIKKYLEPKPVVGGGRKDIEKYNLTYAQLVFGATPYKNPGTYKLYRDMMNTDWGPNYPWKIECSKKLLQLYRTDKPSFMKLANDNKFKGKRAKYRMWTFYDDERDEQDKLKTLTDLKSRISSGELVTIPQSPEKYGYKLRLEGFGVIAELDKANQKNYIATRPETAGGLLWIGTELKRLRAGHSPNFLLDVTSVSRTVEYQRKLTQSNPVATKQLSFHVLGAAFDIARNPLIPDQDRDLRFILDELDSTGMISWIPENDAYHIVVAPNDKAIEFFRRFYNANKDSQMSSALAVTGD